MHVRKKRLRLTVTVVLLCLTALFLYGRLQNARADARRTMCVHNLKQVAIALKMFADDHEGGYPDKISGLCPEYITNLEVLICPELRAKFNKETGRGHPFSPDPDAEEIDLLASYALVPGLRADDSKDLVIAYEKQDNHGGMGRSLLYLDGHGAWEPPENWRNGPPNTNLPEALLNTESD